MIKLIDKMTKEIFSAISKDGNKNVNFSYPGVCNVMSMLLPALSGNTKKEVESKFFKFKKNISNKSVKKNLYDIIGNTPCVENYNYLVYNDEYLHSVIKEDYKNNTITNYNTDCFLVSKEKPMAEFANRMNEKIFKLTNGKISNAIDPAVYNNSFIFELSNVVYFNGEWIDFDGYKTTTLKFRNFDNTIVNATFIQPNNDNIDVYENDKIIGISLPYFSENLRYKFFAFMSKNEEDIRELTFSNIEKKDCRILYAKFPVFKCKCNIDLKSILKQIGISDLFDKNNANLSNGFDIGKNDSVWIEKILQKTFIEVNEKGTEVAAFTTMAVAAGCVDVRESVGLIFNKPFVYFIYDEKEQTNLFMGYVGNLKDNGDKYDGQLLKGISFSYEDEIDS